MSLLALFACAPPEPLDRPAESTQCTAPGDPADPVPVAGAHGAHGLAFTADGRAIGGGPDGNSLVAAVYGQEATLFLPNTGETGQLAALPGGDILVAAPIVGLVRVTPAGAPTVLNPDQRGYAVVVGPDGAAWTADGSRIFRVDVDTGEATVWAGEGLLPAGGPRALAFIGSTLLIGTEGGSIGDIWAVDVDDPQAVPVVFATGVGTGAHHDAIAVDRCGTVWVSDFDTAALYRISAEGDVSTWLDAGAPLGAGYPHGLAFGNDVGGWSSDALYLTLPYQGYAVDELRVGQ